LYSKIIEKLIKHLFILISPLPIRIEGSSYENTFQNK
jgi:hypothetical protein